MHLRSIEQRFWSKVEKTPSCWNWIGSIQQPNKHGFGGGYGRFRSAHKINDYAHRVSYELNIGPIPTGKEIDHLCRNPKCVKPAHLQCVTHRRNVLRGKSPVALNAIKTHCQAGHELKGYNLLAASLKSGKRACRACQNRRNREWRKNGD